ncbi:MAG: hypothetical protein H6745_07830 [Deltaproteobacteria bacterium]|nr:hypothetical protein [Deltaproteobacteria bacterium]
MRGAALAALVAGALLAGCGREEAPSAVVIAFTPRDDAGRLIARADILDVTLAVDGVPVAGAWELVQRDEPVAVAVAVQELDDDAAHEQAWRGAERVLEGLRDGVDWSTLYVVHGDVEQRLAPWSRDRLAARSAIGHVGGPPSEAVSRLVPILRRLARDFEENDDALPRRRLAVVVTDGRDGSRAPRRAREARREDRGDGAASGFTILVIVSDGRDRPDAPAEALERGLGELADVARSTDIDVVVVALARAASREAARLEALARRTRGRLMLVTDLGDDALAAAIVAASHRPNGP